MADEFKIPFEQPKPSRKLHVIGYLISTFWVVGLTGFMALNLPEFRSLKPNEIGDFLGGAFAPMAFLWLVLGFLQQGEELRHSAKALWLQGQELQNSVEQQRELVNVTREQLEFESTMLKAQQEDAARRAQPIVQLRQGGSLSVVPDRRLQTLTLANVGRPATAVSISVDGKPKTNGDVLPTGGQLEFQLELPTTEIEPFRVEVTYLDERNLSGAKVFKVSGHSRLKIEEVSEN